MTYLLLTRNQLIFIAFLFPPSTVLLFKLRLSRVQRTLKLFLFQSTSPRSCRTHPCSLSYSVSLCFHLSWTPASKDCWVSSTTGLSLWPTWSNSAFHTRSWQTPLTWCWGRRTRTTHSARPLGRQSQLQLTTQTRFLRARTISPLQWMKASVTGRTHPLQCRQTRLTKTGGECLRWRDSHLLLSKKDSPAVCTFGCSVLTKLWSFLAGKCLHWQTSEKSLWTE